MIKQNLKIIFRTLLKNRYYTFSLIIGFSLSFLSAFTILLFLIHEFQADTFHKNYRNIYRVLMNDPISHEKGLITFHQLPEKLANFPEIKLATHFYAPGKINISAIDKISTSSLLIENSIYADENFLKIFDFNTLSGNREKLLEAPFNIVLTKELAYKLYGNYDIIGEVIDVNDKPYHVTGVVDNIPSNSHIVFSALLSKSSLPRSEFPLDYPGLTYILLNGNAVVSELESKLSLSQESLIPYEHDSQFEKPFRIEPLKTVYFYESKIPSMFKSILITRELITLKALLLISILILFLSIFNYANYSQSKIFFQAKENLIKRIFGASLLSRWVQFVTEALTIIWISFFISLILIFIFLPFFNGIVDSNISQQYIFDIKVIGSMLLITCMVAIILGSFSYIVDNRLNTLAIKTGNFSFSQGRIRFLNIIFVIQVMGSLCVIALTLVVFGQMKFIKNYDPGYSITNTLEINLNSLPEGYNPQIIKQELEKLPQVISCSVCSGSPLTGRWKSGVKFNDSKIELSSYYGDIDFVNVLKIQIQEGRAFNPEIPSDTTAILINETGKKVFQLNKEFEPIDPQFKLPAKVIGVFKDIIYSNLKDWVSPTLIGYQSYKSIDFDGGKLLIRVNQLDKDLIESVKQIWQGVVRDVPFEYSVLEEKYSSLHQQEFKQSKLFIVGSAISIILCLGGLVGLSLFLSQKKSKSIAIRKVLGATTINLSLMYVYQLAKVIFICSIFTIPMVFSLSHKWLEQFAYKNEPSFMIIIQSFIIMFSVSIFSVLYQIIKTAAENPVETLKHE